MRPKTYGAAAALGADSEDEGDEMQRSNGDQDNSRKRHYLPLSFLVRLEKEED